MAIQDTSATQSSVSSRSHSSAEDLKLLPAVVDAVKAAAQQIQARFSIASRPASREELMAAIEANDAASIAILKPALKEARPGATWVEDEEEGGALPAGECWITDPVEGNINHIHGMNEWGVTVTLVRDNLPILTVVYTPVGGNLYTAVRGAGAQLNSVPLRTSSKTDLSVALVATGQGKPGEGSEIYRQIGQSVTAMLEHALLVRASVPATLLLLEIAAGRMDGFWQYGQVRVGLLPGALLVEEAGGTVTDIQGRPWTTESTTFLATAAGVHRAAVQALSAVV
jgi:myo-inositol-1(or 4)-monophosphatase